VAQRFWPGGAAASGAAGCKGPCGGAAQMGRVLETRRRSS